MKNRLLTLSCWLFICSSLQAQTILHCGTIIDGQSNDITKSASIIVEGDAIVAIERGYVVGNSGDQVIDLKSSTVMPGLMDMHVHITSEVSPTRFADRFRLDPVDHAFESVRYAERTLMAGFTTVRDLGSAFDLAISMRDAINKGYLTGPRIITSGKSLATTGGHADPTNGTNASLVGDPGPKEGVVNSAEDARKAVRQRYKSGADLIKITATGGVLSEASNGSNAQFTEQEIRAIIETARDYDFKVAAHAHGQEGMKRAVIAGITSIEHGTFMDDEVMRLMKKHGTVFVPTILAGKFVAEKAEEDGYFSELIRPKAREIGPQIQDTFAAAYRSGVKIAFGTDTGVSPHGDNWKEFVYMVEAGMPPMEAIQSATMAGAELIGMADKLGSLEVGKIADIVAVGADPLQDISVMEDISFVMKAGKIYKQ